MNQRSTCEKKIKDYKINLKLNYTLIKPQEHRSHHISKIHKYTIPYAAKLHLIPGTINTQQSCLEISPLPRHTEYLPRCRQNLGGCTLSTPIRQVSLSPTSRGTRARIGQVLFRRKKAVDASKKREHGERRASRVVSTTTNDGAVREERVERGTYVVSY